MSPQRYDLHATEGLDKIVQTLQDALDEYHAAVGTNTADAAAHIADTSNPHSVTYVQVGAAALVHTHVVADITDLPAGSDGQIQYNNGGALGAHASLTFDDATSTLTVGALKSNQGGTVTCDENGYITQIARTGGRTTTYSYDGSYNLTSESDAVLTTTYTYVADVLTNWSVAAA